MKTKRFLCVYLPDWSITVAQQLYYQKVGHQSSLAHTTKNHRAPTTDRTAAVVGRPTLLTSTINQIEMVRRCCSLARSYGVRENIPLHLARAMMPHHDTPAKQPLVLPFRPLSDYRSLFRLALRALSISPLVSLDNDLRRAFTSASLLDVDAEYYGFVLDISGTERLHRGEAALIERMQIGFERRGLLLARMAIASTIGCAWAHSRFGPAGTTTIPSSETRNSLLALPIEALRLETAVTATLHELGIETTGQLLTLPLKEIGLRFGIQTIRRIHQAIGSIDEQIEVIKAEPVYRRTKEFEIPLEKLQQAQEVTLQLLHALITELNLYGLKANSFLISITSKPLQASTTHFEKEISLQTASAETASLISIVTPIIESFKLPGSISAISVSAQGVVHQVHEQHQIISSPYERELQLHTEQFLNTLCARFGPSSIHKVRFKNSHIPERSFEFPTILQQDSKSIATSISSVHLPPRPTILFRSPERISAVALLPDRPPAQIEWRKAIFKIVKGLGPERITPEWWEALAATDPSINSLFEQLASFTHQATRDYFTLQDHTGRWLWVYRSQIESEQKIDRRRACNEYSWWMHGIW